MPPASKNDIIPFVIERDPQLRRNEAWRLRFIARLNVCYWQKTVARKGTVRVRVRWGCVIAGFAITVALVFVTKDWFKSVAPAVLTLVVTGGTLVVEIPSSKEARVAFERWSDLSHEVETLWTYGEYYEWDHAKTEPSVQKFVEREKNHQARDIHDPNAKIRKHCHTMVSEELDAESQT